MQTYSATLEAPNFTEISAFTQPKQKEIIVPQEQELSARHINHYIDKPRFRETGYNTTTYGNIGFTRVEATQVTEDGLLQARLDILCDKLRAKY